MIKKIKKHKCDGCISSVDIDGLLACEKTYGSCYNGSAYEQVPDSTTEIKPRTEAENLVVYKRAILKFGQRSQVNVAIEEMSELTKELCKLNRGRDNRDHILEEIADVYIMLHQLTLIFDNPDEMQVIRYIDEKTKRLENLLEG